MSDERDRNAGRSNRTPNRRTVLRTLGTGMAVATGLGATSGTALGNEQESDTVIEELSTAETKRLLDTVQREDEFDVLVDYYERQGFRLNVEESTGFEVDRADEDPFRVLDVPARTDDDSIERAAITAVVQSNGETKFAGTWGVERADAPDEIVTVRVTDDAVAVDRADADGLRAGDDSDVTPRDPWLPDIGCAVCKDIASIACEKGCDIGYGTICSFLGGGLLFKRACKEVAKDMCDIINDETGACDKGASYVCGNILDYC